MRIPYYFIFIIFFCYACENPFAPKLTDINQQVIAIITEQQTPREVLTNFRYAYVFKDSLIYSDTLDSSFIFISKDYSTSPPTDLKWGRDVDIKTTMGLFRSFDVLELDWGNILAYDSTNAQSEIKISFQLTLDGGQNYPTVKGDALFNFRQQPSGRWKIIRWEDLSSF
jgi:hypothetical protein